MQNDTTMHKMARLGDQCDSSSLNGKNGWATCAHFIHWFLFHVLPQRWLAILILPVLHRKQLSLVFLAT